MKFLIDKKYWKTVGSLSLLICMVIGIIIFPAVTMTYIIDCDLVGLLGSIVLIVATLGSGYYIYYHDTHKHN
jgi:hypothetical protein